MLVLRRGDLFKGYALKKLQNVVIIYIHSFDTLLRVRQTFREVGSNPVTPPPPGYGLVCKHFS